MENRLRVVVTCPICGEVVSEYDESPTSDLFNATVDYRRLIEHVREKHPERKDILERLEMELKELEYELLLDLLSCGP